MPQKEIQNPHLVSDRAVLEKYSKDSVYKGNPEFSFLAKDQKTTRDVIEYCHGHVLPVTFCGGQTSMTGASVADRGVAFSLSAQNRILEMGTRSDGTSFVTCEPGVILGDLKKAVEQEGFFYPPDPTSYQEVQVGATVATNATGADTFKYGPTRAYVLGLDVLGADGTQQKLIRTKPWTHSLIKNTAGYFLDGEEIDEVIGSEGTLCLIESVTLKLLRGIQPNIFLLILPFSDFERCIKAVPLIEKLEHKPRALELIGPGAIEYFARCSSCPAELKSEKEKCFLFIKDEYTNEADFDVTLTQWFDRLLPIYTEVDDATALDRIFLAKTDQQLDAIRKCRHDIPSKVNEEYFVYDAVGGGKIGTDWWVPLDRLVGTMLRTYAEALSLRVPFQVYAHIGNGHPHWNFLTKNSDEKKRAIEFVKQQCRWAVQNGGGVAGEHGIGKIKRYLLPIQHSDEVIRKMVALKTKWDPKWLLGQGNILLPPS